ncbi:hypothetical protein [Methylomicrobium lacus]|uniref:hypothetical protein n=1 Tax=Methylomicrobium lacus TaxID=136992 RepID=UPI00045E771D|nr:hypothetical protein [Methylomicrobium lacus]
MHTHPEAWPNRVIVNRSTASASEASARLIAREEIEGPQKTDLNALLRGENGVQWQVSSGILWKLNFNHRDYRQLIVLQFDKANTQKNTPAQLVGNFVFEQFVLQDDVTYCPRKARKNS